MKKVILPFITALFALNLSAQITLHVEPDPLNYTLQGDFSDEWSEVVAHALLTNNTNQTILMRWTRDDSGSTCPAEWQFRICDRNYCYGSNVLSNNVPGGEPKDTVILVPGDTSRLDPHILHHAVAGCCKVKFNLSEIATPNVVFQTVDFDICIEEANAVSDLEKAKLKVTPNPAVNYIAVTNSPFVKQIKISNLLGKPVKSFNNVYEGKYDISDLPDGLYLVSMIDKDDEIIKTMRVVKKGVRP
jgi:hypothetical protein